MRTLLRHLFFENWPRKAISVVLAVIIWFVVNHSLTTTRIISNVAVRVVNLPTGKTVEGMQSNGMLAKRISLTLSGNKDMLDDMTANDLEVVIDGADATGEYSVAVQKKNLVSLNPEIDIASGVNRVSAASLAIRPMRLVTEKIPVIVTSPIGEAPRGYQFLDVFPYRLYLTVSGPEKIIKQLKDRELRLTFNLNEITRAQLDSLAETSTTEKNTDEVSFSVPEAWKQISIPALSDIPFTIDDPDSKFLRIDFVRRNLLPLDIPLPVTLFYPSETLSTVNPNTLHLAPSDLIENRFGTLMITKPLAVKGVSRLFLEIVRDMMQIVVIAEGVRDRSQLPWSLQFIDSRKLEDDYVLLLLAEEGEEEINTLQPELREEYLRNRFRSYMNRLQLFKPNDVKFDLHPVVQTNSVLVQE